MDRSALLSASEHERALYERLGGVYRTLLATLADAAAPVDPASIAAHERDAEATVEALRAVAAALAPHRLGGRPVDADVAALWQASAALAAAALAANRALAAHARARQGALTERLAQVDRGRRGLAGYRAAVERA
jgi:hypothetical protein